MKTSPGRQTHAAHLLCVAFGLILGPALSQAAPIWNSDSRFVAAEAYFWPFDGPFNSEVERSEPDSAFAPFSGSVHVAAGGTRNYLMGDASQDSEYTADSFTCAISYEAEIMLRGDLEGDGDLLVAAGTDASFSLLAPHYFELDFSGYSPGGPAHELELVNEADGTHLLFENLGSESLVTAILLPPGTYDFNYDLVGIQLMPDSWYDSKWAGGDATFTFRLLALGDESSPAMLLGMVLPVLVALARRGRRRAVA